MSNSYYVTTPIYYANGHPHLGNTYTTTIADILTRYQKFSGKDVYFLTGTDEHGDKVAEAAGKAGKSPYDFTTEVAQKFKDAWAKLGLEYDRFIRTTDDDHKKVVKDTLQKIYDQGDIYFGEYGGNYCTGCERFLTDKELVDGKCPDHQVEPKFVSEKNYFFRMSKYQDQLIQHINNNPDFIRPERYKNEALAMLREPLEDLCISRPKSRLTWGIELPFDNNYVTYVWFDALINYLTGIGYPDNSNFDKYWNVAEHLVAKDILKPHAIFWPTMLFAMGLKPYKHLNVHGYWVTPIGKMSKSLGNVVNPLEISQKFGNDAFRYFIIREMVFGLDGTFSDESFETRYNSDLANNLGNLVSRSISMLEKYRNGAVPKINLEENFEEERDLLASINSLSHDLNHHMNKLELNRAIERIWSLISETNLFIDKTKPWQLDKDSKSEDASVSKEAASKLDRSLYFQLESIRIIAQIISPFIPESSKKILMAFPDDLRQPSNGEVKWGLLKAGSTITKIENLFPRTDNLKNNNIKESNTKKMDTEKKDTEKNTQPEIVPSSPAPISPAPISPTLISYDDFAKVSLKVGKILAAEKIEKSEKLLKLQVDLGEETPRQIVAGIAKRYSAEDLVGRKVVVVSNLKPAKLMGNESNGMLLAGSDDLGNLELVEPAGILAVGAIVK